MNRERSESMFQNALVPVDGSDVATAALDCVAKAVSPETRVVLLQVVDSPDRIARVTTPAGFEFGISSVEPTVIDSVVQAQHEAANRHLESARTRLMALGVTEIETMIAVGSPGEEIVRIAAAGGFDLIVMGTHGRS